MASTNGTAPSTLIPSVESSPPSSPSSPPSPSNPPSPSSPADNSSPVAPPPASTPEPSTPQPSSPPPNTEPSTASPPPNSEPSLPPSSSPQPSTPNEPSTPTPTPSQPPSSNPPSSNPPSSEPPKSTPTPTPSTDIITSVITETDQDGKTKPPSTVIITSIITSPPNPSDPSKSIPDANQTGTSPAGLQDLAKSKDSGGLGTGGKTAIAVVVPVVAVAALVIAGILLWRRRKQKKNAEEARRKEVEEYGFNPNNDPTLPAVGMTSEMAEDQSGYRGWGNTTTSSNRKASTTLTSGMTGYSDSNSNPGGYASPGSPTQAYSDNQSNDPLMSGRRETMDSEGIGALGAAPNSNQNRSDIRRGPSNASSSYSAANRSDNSGDYPVPMNNPQEYYSDNNNYYHASPYDPYSGGQPVIRDVSARRNTRIENPSVFPQQGNSGIAQNF